MPKIQALGLRSLPPLQAEEAKSQAARAREAREYWDSLTLEQEVWALRKMGFFTWATLPVRDRHAGWRR